MTPQARASAIRDLIKQIEDHQTALATEGFNTYVYTSHLRSNQTFGSRIRNGQVERGTFVGAKEITTRETI